LSCRPRCGRCSEGVGGTGTWYPRNTLHLENGKVLASQSRMPRLEPVLYLYIHPWLEDTHI
jgi:hypothetical protein